MHIPVTMVTGLSPTYICIYMKCIPCSTFFSLHTISINYISGLFFLPTSISSIRSKSWDIIGCFPSENANQEADRLNGTINFYWNEEVPDKPQWNIVFNIKRQFTAIRDKEVWSKCRIGYFQQFWVRFISLRPLYPNTKSAEAGIRTGTIMIGAPVLETGDSQVFRLSGIGVQINTLKKNRNNLYSTEYDYDNLIRCFIMRLEKTCQMTFATIDISD